MSIDPADLVAVRARLAQERMTNDLAALFAEVEGLRARLSRCKYCGGNVADTGGGHSSGCYETTLNKMKVEVESLRQQVKDQQTRVPIAGEWYVPESMLQAIKAENRRLVELLVKLEAQYEERSKG